MERTRHLFISWDWENVRAGNASAVAMRVVSRLLKFLPHVFINSFKAYANTKQISSAQCLGCNDSAVSLMFVPQGSNAADYAMISDLMLLAKDAPPASYFMVITGDRDFCPSLRALREFGHTVLLTYPEDRTHDDLFGVCDFSISWETLTGLNLRGNPFRYLPRPPQPVISVSFTAVFWDFIACPPRQNNFKKAVACVDGFLLSHPETARAATRRYRAYSNIRSIEQYLPDPVEYVFVSRARDNKQQSVELTMLVDVMKFINETAAPANIVLLTSNLKMARTIQALKQRGYNVLVVVPDTGGAGLNLLEAAGDPDVYSWASLLNQY